MSTPVHPVIKHGVSGLLYSGWGSERFPPLSCLHSSFFPIVIITIIMGLLSFQHHGIRSNGIMGLPSVQHQAKPGLIGAHFALCFLVSFGWEQPRLKKQANAKDERNADGEGEPQILV